VTAPGPLAAGPGASDPGRSGPALYDLFITDDPDAGWSDPDYDAEAAEYDVEPEAGL
jgi:hypothetical protein